MRIQELMTTLVSLYPAAFGRPETQAAWAREYHAALGRFEGEQLAEAWRRVREQWDKAGFPKPADILRVMPRQVAMAPTQATGATNMRLVMDYVRENRDRMVKESAQDAMRRAGRDLTDNARGWLRWRLTDIVTTYLQADAWHSSGAMPEEQFREFRWKLTDAEIENLVWLCTQDGEGGNLRARVRRPRAPEMDDEAAA